MKTIFLTGASAGIGRAIAEALAEGGHRVWGTSRALSRLPKHANFHPIEMDLCDMSSLHAGAARAMAESGGFDVLINNAGAGVFSASEQLSHEKLTSQFQLLVFAPMELVKIMLPAMRSRDGALIINITSLAALFPIPYMGAYSACKAALSSLSWSLGMELCRDAVRVVEIRPGDICTEFHKSMECDKTTSSALESDNFARAYSVYTERMQRAPSPECVVREVLSLLEDGEKAPSPRNVGGTFQAQIAPLLSRVSPRAWMRLALEKYYRLKCGRS
jgi:short-subunit dehydrogenase